jgi:transcription-repair coupling factor (superfamily II helicase)
VDVIQRLANDPAVVELASMLEARRRVVASGGIGASTAVLAAALARRTGRTVLLAVAHLDDADDDTDAIIDLGGSAVRFPAQEVIPGESAAATDLFAERLDVVRRLRAGIVEPLVVVAPIQALMQEVPAPSRLDVLSLSLGPGVSLTPQALARWLDAAGYARRDAIDEPGDYAVRGGIVDVFPATGQAPLRVEFAGDAIERVSEIDAGTMASDRVLSSPVTLVCTDPAGEAADTCPFLELAPAGCLALIAETAEVVEQGRGYYERVIDARKVLGPPAVLKSLETRFHALAEVNHYSTSAASADAHVALPVSALPTFSADAADAVRELAGPDGPRVLVLCQTEGERTRFDELLAQQAARLDPEQAPEALGRLRTRIESRSGFMRAGFGWRADQAEGFLVLPYHEMLGRAPARRHAATRLRPSRALDTFLEFAPGDLVVHAEHGIARYVGLSIMSRRRGRDRAAGAEAEEFLTLEFAGRSRLHVPVSQIDLVQRYVGGGGGRPPLSTLGGHKWRGQKERVAGAVRDLAAELLRVRAARESLPGIAYPDDTAWQREFEAEFPFPETEDQIAALAEIKRDMRRPRPMDRLLCGDVGFGKTELAIRAAFKAVEFGKQVAVLVPTTVLADQHERTFRERFADYPFRVESLSRFKSAPDARAILEDARRGRIDILIGTHRLLSPDVEFADLGLVIIDEEQRFGVEHKERLLRLRLTTDVLTLSATPIPRTLHMSLLGLRDISSLATPPADRRAIVTEVVPWNEKRLARAIARELAREGQVFYVHNRVHDIAQAADRVRALAPGARVVIGHGQMSDDELEEVMLRFTRRQADILVCTTIIESGVDIPTANTIIIDDADRFGLADLHQLRGRVGRGKHRGYCYLILPRDRPVSDIAAKRLRAIEQYSMLGAGFRIAMRDLETRGAGNLLGPEQSGHIAAVGYDMYCRLLERAVQELNRQTPPPSPASVGVELGIGAAIPRTYIPSDARRLETYRRIATAASAEDLTRIAAGLADAYGPPPESVRRLLDLAELRIACACLGVRSVSIRDRDVVFRTVAPASLVQRLRGARGTVVELPSKDPAEPAEVYYRPPASHLEPDTLLAILRKRLAQ